MAKPSPAKPGPAKRARRAAPGQAASGQHGAGGPASDGAGHCGRRGVPGVPRSGGPRSGGPRLSGSGGGITAGRVLARATLLPPVLLMAWLLPGLPLLLAGRFTAGLMLAIWVPLAAALTVAVLVFGPVPWPHRRTPWWSVAAVFAIAAGFAVWQAAVHSQQVIVRRDPATYLQFGYWIARHGSLPIPQLRSAFGGALPGLSFASPGFYQHGTVIVPQFMAGLPITLAAAFWINGIELAVLMAPVIGACAVLTFGGLVGRLCGPRWAPLGALVLALSLPEQYTSRSTFSEPLAQILLFGGFCLVTDALGTATAGRPAPAAGGAQPRTRGAAWLMAALGGLAFGLSTLVRIDGMSDILPVILFCGVLYATRRQLALPLAAGLAIGAAYGLADGYALSRPYLNSLSSLMRPLGYAAAGFAAVTAAVIAVSRWGRMPQLRRRRWSWVPNIAALAVVLVMAGFAFRPLFQTARGETNPVTIAFIALVQKLAHLPIDPHRTYAEDSLYWVIWYIGLPAVLLATFGAALLTRRFLRGLTLSGPAPSSSPAPSSGPAPSGPGPERPGPERPGPERPGPERPGPELPGPDRPGPERPGPERRRRPDMGPAGYGHRLVGRHHTVEARDHPRSALGEPPPGTRRVARAGAIRGLDVRLAGQAGPGAGGGADRAGSGSRVLRGRAAGAGRGHQLRPWPRTRAARRHQDHRGRARVQAHGHR